MKQVYLDYAAATPMDPKVAQAMAPYLSDQFYNPSAMYLSAQTVRRHIDEARHDIAKILGAKSSEIIFTSGATEANNLAIRGIGDGIIISAIEHESVLAPAIELRAKIAPVDNKGILILPELEKLIEDSTNLISVIMVSNELGTLQPITQIAELIKNVRADRLSRGIDNPLYLHTDAAQAANFFELNVSRLGVDMMTINGSKLYGPKQTGILYVRAGVKLQPQITGGGQEFGLRSGTENVAGVIGLAEALMIAHKMRGGEVARLQELRTEFIARLEKSVPQIVFNGHAKKAAPHIVNVLLPGQDAERLMMELDEQGIMTAVGSACSAADEEPSHVLRAIGLTEAEARACLRFSFGRQTTSAELEKATIFLSRLIAD